MRRKTMGICSVALLSLGLAACSTTPPGMPGKTLKTQQATTYATPEGGSVTSYTTTETCPVTTVVQDAMPVQVPVMTATPVTTAVPCTSLVPVTQAVPVTTIVPSVSCATTAVPVPRPVTTAVQTPVTYSQYTTPLTRSGGCDSCGFGGIGGYGLGGYGAFGYGGLGYGGFGCGGCGYGGYGGAFW